MIYLTTGGNGAGKTLFTLKAVRELQLERIAKGRPSQVYYSIDTDKREGDVSGDVRGRFELSEEGKKFGWLPIDAKTWWDMPDESIFLFDECQFDFPATGPRDKVPDYVSNMAIHRKRGFDIFLITQHPGLINPFIRKLIASPGWHRHYKRVSASSFSRRLEWPSVEMNCEKMGSGKSADVKTVPFPKEVYGWYVSAVLHTGKFRFSKQMKILILAILLLIPMCYGAYWAYLRYMPGAADAAGKPNEQGVKPGQGAQLGAGPQGANAPQHVLTPAEYAAQYVARFPGLPATAPRYDKITEPTEAPYPAACIAMGPRCSCYTQQATPLNTPIALCLQIVKGGYFMDWHNKAPDSIGGRQDAKTGDAQAQQLPQSVGRPADLAPVSTPLITLPPDPQRQHYAHLPGGH
jgi:zona occludens toxin